MLCGSGLPVRPTSLWRLSHPTSFCETVKLREGDGSNKKGAVTEESGGPITRAMEMQTKSNDWARGFEGVVGVTRGQYSISRLNIVDKILVTGDRQLLTGCPQVDITSMGQLFVR